MESTLINGIDSQSFESNLYRKLSLRIMPIIFFIFLLSFLDRVNIGYAHIQLKSDLGLTDAQFGIAAGIFSLSYLVCEFPVSIFFPRIGARKTLLRIAFLWGITSSLVMFVNSANQLYALRFILGAFEAGCLPAVLLHIRNWFPAHKRGSATGMFMVATGVAIMIGGPLSGWVMTSLDGYMGMSGWRWLFPIEGLPTVFLGILAYFIVVDKPNDASWLSQNEKDFLNAELAKEQPKPHEKGGVINALKDKNTLLFILMLFFATSGGYAISFWLPTMIKTLGVDSILSIGWLSAIPSIFGCLGFVLYGYISDKFNKPKSVFFSVCIIAGISFIASFFVSESVNLNLMFVSIANFCISGAITTFWTLPTAYYKGDKNSGSIAIVNIGNIMAGMLSPIIIGFVSSNLGNVYYGISVIGVGLIIGAFLTLLLIRSESRKLSFN